MIKFNVGNSKWSSTFTIAMGHPLKFHKTPNPISHLMVSSFKKAKEKKKDHYPTVSLVNSFLLHLISSTFVTRIYSRNWSWIRCLMAYEPHP
jgi:hypothetical protein